MEQTAPAAVADEDQGRSGRRRQCLSCGLHIYNGKPAVRVGDFNGQNTHYAKLRFWLCRGCADVIETTLANRRAS